MLITYMQGFDEFMNLVVDDAVEVKQPTKTDPDTSRRNLGMRQTTIRGAINYRFTDEMMTRTNPSQGRQRFSDPNAVIVSTILDHTSSRHDENDTAHGYAINTANLEGRTSERTNKQTSMVTLAAYSMTTTLKTAPTQAWHPNSRCPPQPHQPSNPRIRSADVSDGRASVDPERIPLR